MIRQLITIAVPLLAPVALYLLYTWHLRRKGGDVSEEDPFSWREIPWIWLLVCGAALLSATMVATTFIGRTDAGARYEAPRFEDGKRVPGQFVK
tara:strand:- start:540 stop:821 length:282 start_codon:yes stop_codon:yes gene_type:complete